MTYRFSIPTTVRAMGRASLLGWSLLVAAAGAAATGGDHAAVDSLIQARRYDEARALADKFLADRPRDVQMRFLKGVIQLETDRRSEAIATFTQLTQDAPELPEPYNNLAVLYASQGQYDRARAALESSLRTNPSYATAQENLGDVYARLAADAYSQALQMEGSSPAAAPKLAAIRSLFQGPGAPAAGSAALASAQAAGASRRAQAAVASAPAAAPPAVAVAAAPAAPARPVPAAAAPEPKAVPVPAPAPVAASTAAPASSEAAAKQAVEQAVRAWAAAWSAKDMQRYLDAYAKDFVPAGGQSRKAWEEERRVRIEGKTDIQVSLDDLVIGIDGDTARARFRQSYRSNALNVRSRKTLELKREGADWHITREAVGNS